MAPDRRKPPGGFGRLSKSVLADGFDALRVNPKAPKKQALPPPRAQFARAMVFEEFTYKHGRALDYGGFVDSRPNQAPRSWVAPR